MTHLDLVGSPALSAAQRNPPAAHDLLTGAFDRPPPDLRTPTVAEECADVVGGRALAGVDHLHALDCLSGVGDRRGMVSSEDDRDCFAADEGEHGQALNELVACGFQRCGGHKPLQRGPGVDHVVAVNDQPVHADQTNRMLSWPTKMSDWSMPASAVSCSTAPKNALLTGATNHNSANTP